MWELTFPWPAATANLSARGGQSEVQLLTEFVPRENSAPLEKQGCQEWRFPFPALRCFEVAQERVALSPCT